MTKRRWLIAFLAVVAAVICTCAGLTAYVFLKPSPRGAGAYPAFRAANAAYIPFMPPALTPSMKGVRFITHGFEAIHGPDGYVELRFILPAAEAAALEAASTTSATALAATPGAPALESYASMIDSLQTADDENPNTALPKGFRSFILFHSNSNVGGVTINAASGEVIYWRFDF